MLRPTHTHVHTHTHTHTHTPIPTRTYTHTYTHTHTHTLIPTQTYTHTYTNMHTVYQRLLDHIPKDSHKHLTVHNTSSDLETHTQSVTHPVLAQRCVCVCVC